MNPTPSDVHVNSLLTNVSISYQQEQTEFVADRAFPMVPVEKQSDLYPEFDRADQNRNSMTKRAPATESAGDGFRVSTNPYYCDVFGLHKDIDDQLRRNSDSVWDLDAAATRFLEGKALIKREVDFATDFMTTGVWTGILTGVASTPSANQALQWNDGDSTPIEDIRAQRAAVKLLTGYRPNKLILGELVYNQLLDHPDIVDRIKGGSNSGSPAIVQKSLLAALLELEEILVMGAIYNTAKEGQTASNARIGGGKSALLVYTPSAPSLMTPSAGYTFAWRGYLGGATAQAIYRFRMEHLKSDRIEIEAAYDQKKTGADLGVYFASIVA